jgi:hypothetical protein
LIGALLDPYLGVDVVIEGAQEGTEPPAPTHSFTQAPLRGYALWHRLRASGALLAGLAGFATWDRFCRSFSASPVNEVLTRLRMKLRDFRHKRRIPLSDQPPRWYRSAFPPRASLTRAWDPWLIQRTRVTSVVEVRPRGGWATLPRATHQVLWWFRQTIASDRVVCVPLPLSPTPSALQARIAALRNLVR